MLRVSNATQSSKNMCGDSIISAYFYWNICKLILSPNPIEQRVAKISNNLLAEIDVIVITELADGLVFNQ